MHPPYESATHLIVYNFLCSPLGPDYSVTVAATVVIAATRWLITVACSRGIKANGSFLRPQLEYGAYANLRDVASVSRHPARGGVPDSSPPWDSLHWNRPGVAREGRSDRGRWDDALSAATLQRMALYYCPSTFAALADAMPPPAVAPPPGPPCGRGCTTFCPPPAAGVRSGRLSAAYSCRGGHRPRLTGPGVAVQLAWRRPGSWDGPCGAARQRRSRARGLSHAVRYGRRSALGAATVDLRLGAASQGPGSYLADAPLVWPRCSGTTVMGLPARLKRQISITMESPARTISPMPAICRYAHSRPCQQPPAGPGVGWQTHYPD